MSKGWIGVDLDGTLAQYGKWIGPEHIGEPVPAMLERVKRWLADGQDVRIFTARVDGHGHSALLAKAFIDQWCLRHVGRVLPVTNVKDFAMIELWDDRCVQVEKNTGRVVSNGEGSRWT